MLYTLAEMQRDSWEPARLMAQQSKDFYKKFFPDTKFSRSMAAGAEMVERLTRRYDKPDFDITTTTVDGKEIKIKEVKVVQKTFSYIKRYPK